MISIRDSRQHHDRLDSHLPATRYGTTYIYTWRINIVVLDLSWPQFGYQYHHGIAFWVVLNLEYTLNEMLKVLIEFRPIPAWVPAMVCTIHKEYSLDSFADGSTLLAPFGRCGIAVNSCGEQNSYTHNTAWTWTTPGEPRPRRPEPADASSTLNNISQDPNQCFQKPRRAEANSTSVHGRRVQTSGEHSDLGHMLLRIANGFWDYVQHQ
jgi:hypothetical protein